MAVGSEWASDASAVPGRGGARAALREAGEEAGEKLAWQGTKRAVRELPPVVIGENMERVKAYARWIGAQHINHFIPENAWTLERNIAWIQQMMSEGRLVIDIGPDFARRLGRYSRIRAGEIGVPDPVARPYNIERQLLKQYRLYEKHFVRFGKWEGGVTWFD